jgi:hypothetical protein
MIAIPNNVCKVTVTVLGEDYCNIVEDYCNNTSTIIIIYSIMTCYR